MHHHHHHHHHHIATEATKGKLFIWAIVLNTVFVIAEFIAGTVSNSTGLIADAGHNLSDVSGLLISLIAFLLARTHYRRNYTYGFRKGTIWASLLNAIILLVAVGIILYECIQKVLFPKPVAGLTIIITAGIGIFINGLTALFFVKSKDHDLNVKGAYLHMLADTLVSIGVVCSGIFIFWSGWSLIDPIIGIVIACVILTSTWGLLKESIRLAMDGVPGGIHIDTIYKHLLAQPNVKDVHHLHLWPLSTTENALTAHVVLNNIQDMEKSRAHLRQELAEHGIAHVTLEFETQHTNCHDKIPFEKNAISVRA